MNITDANNGVYKSFVYEMYPYVKNNGIFCCPSAPGKANIVKDAGYGYPGSSYAANGVLCTKDAVSMAQVARPSENHPKKSDDFLGWFSGVVFMDFHNKCSSFCIS